MIKKYILLFLLYFAISHTLFSQQSADERAGIAMNEGNYFDLYRIYDKEKESLSPFMRQFSKSIIDSFFNRPESAVESINVLLNEYGDILGNENTMSMISLLASNYASIGEYNRAKDIIYSVIVQIPDCEEILSYKNLYNQYYELSKYEINVINKPNKDVIIPFDLEQNWNELPGEFTMMIDATVNGKPIRILFDTGASVNVVNKNSFENLCMNGLPVQSFVKGIDVQNGIIALAQELVIGDLKMNNVPFHVIDISSGVDSIDKLMPKMDMIIGVEWINQMQEVQIDFKHNQLIVPQKLSKNKHCMPNMFGFNKTSYGVEVETSKGNVILDLDTGSAFSNLSHKYYEKFKDEIRDKCCLDSIGIAGAGGVKRMKIYRLPQFDFKIANNNFLLENIAVETEQSLFANDGILGLDALMQCDKIIINAKDMFVDVQIE